MEKYVFNFLDALFRLAEFVTGRFPAPTDKPKVEVPVERIKFSPTDYIEEAV